VFTAKKTPADQIPVGLWAQFRRHSPGYAAGLIFLGVYHYFQYLFDTQLDRAVDVAIGGVAGSAAVLGASLVGIAGVSVVVRVLSRMAVFNGGRNAEYELRRAVLHHLHKLGSSFYSQMTTGDIMSRVTNDLGQVRLLLGFGVLNFFGTIFALISALAVTLERSVKLTLASLAAMPVLVIVVLFFSRAMFTKQRENQDAIGKLSSRVQSSIAGIRVVRSFGLEEAEREQFEKVNAEYLAKSLSLANLRGIMWPIMEVISSIGIVVLLWYGGYLMLTEPSFDAGGFVAFFRALSRLTWPLISLGFMISVIQRGRASYSRITELLETVPEIQDGTEDLPRAPLALEVRDLSFSHGSKQVLKGVSLSLPPGGSLAIVGRTGSGKTTLAWLLARLLPTPRGTVFLGNTDVCDVKLADLRRAVGYAQQDPFLFSTTVARNIGFGLDDPESDISEKRVREAASEAHILEEIKELPQGFDTVVGERGVQLSGGQKQRISLARALVSEPSILVLDDPLSAVDARTETAILAALDRQRARRGVILITHRVSAAKRCDQILVLEDGRVAEQGTHEQLVKSGGLYSIFHEEQRIEHELERIGAADLPALGQSA
jgi:ATP-binding cassette subfamily B protein